MNVVEIWFVNFYGWVKWKEKIDQRNKLEDKWKILEIWYLKRDILNKN